MHLPRLLLIFLLFLCCLQTEFLIRKNINMNQYFYINNNRYKITIINAILYNLKQFMKDSKLELNNSNLEISRI